MISFGTLISVASLIRCANHSTVCLRLFSSMYIFLLWYKRICLDFFFSLSLANLSISLTVSLSIYVSEFDFVCCSSCSFYGCIVSSCLNRSLLSCARIRNCNFRSLETEGEEEGEEEEEGGG